MARLLPSLNDLGGIRVTQFCYLAKAAVKLRHCVELGGFLSRDGRPLIFKVNQLFDYRRQVYAGG